MKWHCKNIVERPKFLDSFPPGGRSEKTLSILKIAETLKKIKRTECLRFSSSEFEKEFGVAKKAKPYLIATLKRFNIKKPRIIFDQGTCYIWSNDE